MIYASCKTMLKHKNPDWHPEQPDRIAYIWKAVENAFGRNAITIIERKAKKEELYLAHSLDYINYLFSIRGSVDLDYETFFSEHTLDAVLSAAGICLELVEHIIQGTYKKCFALVRPPGHHATYTGAMGYCIVNNMAVAVNKALAMGLERIVIIDWDVHHGNGTQEIFFETDAVYFIDIHQENLFPENSGNVDETGRDRGKGFTLNIPVPAGKDGNYYLDIMDAVAYPILRRFSPQLLCISSGFDALGGDSEGAMHLVPTDYRELTRKVCLWADELCEGKLLMVLEGGYCIPSVSEAVCTILENWEEKL
ncbi:MAG: histone deacetylase [Treponema sp.]|jgi:acetoin utilization deacetylase AcuC-like enzyme|nr:histone deacetylase [Treponema sp.]